MSSTISASPSASSSSRSQVEIPSSTVIAIGLGFLGLTLFLLAFSMVTRILQIQRRTNAGRAAGSTLSFREVWRNEGGMFGFLNTMGGGTYGAAGGWNAAQRMEMLRRQQERIWGSVALEKKDPPIIWEVPVTEKGLPQERGDDLEPFALYSSRRPRYIDRALPETEMPQPRIIFDILVALPTDHSSVRASLPGVTKQRHPEPGNEGEWAELPELVIGTTQIIPMYTETEEDGETLKRRLSSKSSGELARKGSYAYSSTTVPQLGYQTGGTRPARWEKLAGATWRIEGMG